MPRYLGIDFGTRRIGLSVGDTDGAIVSPVGTIEVRGYVDEQVHAVLDKAAEYGVGGFVVGLPLNMDGTESAQSAITRKFGERLRAAASKPVHYQDERLSSLAADALLEAAELTKKKRKQRRDQLAAVVILQSFLDTKPPTEEP